MNDHLEHNNKINYLNETIKMSENIKMNDRPFGRSNTSTSYSNNNNYNNSNNSYNNNNNYNNNTHNNNNNNNIFLSSSTNYEMGNVRINNTSRVPSMNSVYNNINTKPVEMNDIPRPDMIHINNGMNTNHIINSNMNVVGKFITPDVYAGEYYDKDININEAENMFNKNISEHVNINDFSEKGLNGLMTNDSNRISGNMNTAHINNNINNETAEDALEIFPFYKTLNNLRLKIGNLYNVDNDVIIYRCMCALVPYLNVDRKYESVDNEVDIERNIIGRTTEGNENEEEEDEDEDENKDQEKDKILTGSRESINMTQHKREISNVNDAFDYFENKLCIERNPDIYGFIWLNFFVCFFIFFLFNMRNMFSHENMLNGNNVKDTRTILINTYIMKNKLHILYYLLLSVFLFNSLVPILMYSIVYFATHKTVPFKLVYLISLMSYNNIILVPISFLYKITNFDAEISFIIFLRRFIHLLIFCFYMSTSFYYIYKYTIKVFKNYFEENLLYILYGVILILYFFYYLFFLKYVFHYL